MTQRKKAPPAPEFVQVNVRLYAEDVAELVRQAKADGTEWHPRLRRLVHEAVQAGKRVIR